MLYDPSGSVPDVPGVERVGWSPLGPARTWDQAVLVAESMVRAARPGAERGEAAHWSERASALLAALFHAGALAGQPFSKVVAGVDRHEPDEALGILARHGAERALDLLDGIVSTDGREQSGIWSTASGVLAGYRTDAALASAAVTPLDVADCWTTGELSMSVPGATSSARPLRSSLVSCARCAPPLISDHSRRR